MNESTVSGDSSSGNQTYPKNPPLRKKRNLPGMPDPDAEVIALSPKTLLATNRFVCEICNKGFQRDQNLQLHRRGHNLPWKLRQRSSKDVKKRVYICPEPGCVHHDPARALGDLTGIKKHFCRKHGEKKWKCEKCSKKYAVQSDWKAHSKICGTREYRCDCGTLFSRRDSFITHRAFCDALAEESAKTARTTEVPLIPEEDEEDKSKTVEALKLSPPPAATSPPLPPEEAPAPPVPVVNSVLPVMCPELPKTTCPNPPTAPTLSDIPSIADIKPSCGSTSSCSSSAISSSNVLATIFAPPTSSGSFHSSQPTGFTEMFQPDVQPPEPVSLCLATNQGSSIFERRQYAPALSATALLQKAAQMGPKSNSSLLMGLGVVSSSSGPDGPCGQQLESNGVSLAGGLSLGLTREGGSGLKELMMGTPSSVFGPERATLDLFGLGMAAAGSGSGSGLSALMTSIDVARSFGGGEYSGQDMGRGS
ncbi:Protein indeterminate-domain 1 [Striga hermonthica]|uniref:Protein indeterminate-domain 1 n=1 Tax=Striga hermonthica TaxID=68872 RepID=A0A9N7MXM2_STRHE|nr:Protein indeterminate-domain 1 [Striga hermonthica]